MAEDRLALLAAMQNRRSIRRYRPEPVPASLLQQLLTAANWAPSAHNRQPWRFVVIRPGPVKERLAGAMGARLRADLEADGVPQAMIERDTGRSYQRLAQAPVLVLLCLTMADMERYSDARRQAHERTMAVQSVAMAGQNLLLAAHVLGLGACWLCAPLFCPETVRETLALPASWEPQGLITLGFPAEERVKGREPLAERVRFI